MSFIGTKKKAQDGAPVIQEQQMKAEAYDAEPQGPAFGDAGLPYRDQWELMTDVFALIDYRLYLYYKSHQWLGPRNDMKNMLGLVVTREEFEHNLVKAAQTGLLTHVSDDDRKQMEFSEAVVAERMAMSRADIPVLRLAERFKLNEFEKNIVLLAYAGALEHKYERLFAYLQDDITKKAPGVALAVQLYLPEGSTVEEYTSYFDRETPFTSLFSTKDKTEGSLVLKSPVTEYLSTGKVAPGRGMTLFDGRGTPVTDPLIGAREIAAELDEAMDADETLVAAITGERGSGRSFQVRQLMTRRGERCLFADMDALEHDRAAVADAALTARLADAYLCFTGLDVHAADGTLEAPSAALTDTIEHADRGSRKTLFLISEKPACRQTPQTVLDCRVEPCTAEERLQLFEHYFAPVPIEDDVSLEELAAKFRFTPLQIRLAARQAEGLSRIDGCALSNAAIHRCCYRQAVHKLDALATPVEPRFTWDDVVMPESQKTLMKQACAHIRYQHRVYQEWGFEKKIGYGRGLSILFAGAPGTGKTMCAQVIAKQLNMQMYRINISQIVSKYIGETEKNLQALFAEARRSNSILFFDECDAIFGKRSDVKDAHDRNANVEVAYLLQQIEDHDGVCVLATNLIQNIDAAFMRRITYVVHFPFPDAAMRKAIYLRTLPESAPTEDGIDWDFLAERFELSGGHIKNIVLEAAFMAAAGSKAIGMRELINAAVNELKKNEMVVVREELREYADLICN